MNCALSIAADTSNRATAYACALVFERWAGWPIEWNHRSGPLVDIALHGSAEPVLSLPGVGDECALPAETLLRRVFSAGSVQRLRADSGQSLRQVFGFTDWIDQALLSTIFHIVSGSAEANSGRRDAHGRFPAVKSLMYQLGVLDLPIVDLLAEYLGERIKMAAPRLGHKPRTFEIVSTHDVDAPFKYAFMSPVELLRSIAGDVLRRRNLSTLVEGPRRWASVRRGRVEDDPFNCFERMLQIDERRGLRSDFYFIAGNTAGRIDGDYRIEDPLIRALLRRVVSGGHRIGLHPSYHAPMRGEALQSERKRLADAAREEGYVLPIELVRTHYLRFDPALTPALLQQAGFVQDSSLGFADAAGFRRGTCREFPLWDAVTGRPLEIVEQSLIAMECSLLTPRYEALTREEAAAKLDRLKAECRRFGGRFVVLWHNNYLVREEDFELYEYAIA